MRKRGFISNHYGFTLIEIIAVLIILGILAAVAVPRYFNMQEEAIKKTIEGGVAELNGQVKMLWGSNLLKGEATTYKGYLGNNSLGADFTLTEQTVDITPATGTIKLTAQADTYTLTWVIGTDNSPGYFTLGAKVVES